MCRFIRKWLIMLCLLFLPLLTTSCASPLVDKVKAFQESHNRLDVEKLLELSTDDVKQEGSGGYQWIMQEALLNSRIFLTDIKVDGDVVTCKAKQQDDWYKIAGINAVYYESFQLTFKDGLIKDIESKYTQESTDAIHAFRATFHKWTVEKLGKEGIELRRRNVTIENVDKWMTLLREWREETEKKENQ